MSETQPDMLGGKTVPGSRLRRIRKTGKPPIARTGWADTPGTGPSGETCGSCTYCEAFHYRKRYHKCAARDGDHWKGGRETDIRPLDPTCSKWAPSVNRANQPKASSHETDSVANVDPGSRSDPRRQGSAERQADREHNPGGSGQPVARRDPQPSASRSRNVGNLARDLAQEGLQRVFEF